jgi:hypothetical protein
VAYGGGLENRSSTLSGRGFESHPLRQLERERFGSPSARARQPVYGQSFASRIFKAVVPNRESPKMVCRKSTKNRALEIKNT